ncbi:MAG: tetratricopeptide repeat protein [Crocosphaera sp.]
MHLFINRLIAISLCLTPVTLTVTSQPSWGQNQSLEVSIQELTEDATQQTEQGKSLQGIETWQQVLDIARQNDRKSLEAFALVGLGLNYHDLKQPEKALEYYQQALPIAQRVGDRRLIGATFNNMGASYQRLGQYQEALAYYTRALPLTQQVDKLADIAKTLNNIGEVYSLTGKQATASQYYQEALFLAQKTGDPILEQEIRNNIAQN